MTSEVLWTQSMVALIWIYIISSIFRSIMNTIPMKEHQGRFEFRVVAGI